MRYKIALIAFAVVLAGCTAPVDDTDTDDTTTTPDGDDATGAPDDGDDTGGDASPDGNGETDSGERDDPLLVHSVQDEKGDYFDPVDITVSAGDTVTWDVKGRGHHTVDFHEPVNGDGTPPSSGDMGPDDEFQVTFPEPGEYAYYCLYHSDGESGMVGTVTVT